jgi:hypothetical protein
LGPAAHSARLYADRVPCHCRHRSSGVCNVTGPVAACRSGQYANAAMDQIVSHLRNAREAAIARRRLVQVKLIGNNVVHLMRLKQPTCATVLSTPPPDGRTQFITFTGILDTPDGFGNGGAIELGSVVGGPPCSTKAMEPSSTPHAQPISPANAHFPRRRRHRFHRTPSPHSVAVGLPLFRAAAHSASLDPAFHARVPQNCGTPRLPVP